MGRDEVKEPLMGMGVDEKEGKLMGRNRVALGRMVYGSE